MRGVWLWLQQLSRQTVYCHLMPQIIVDTHDYGDPRIKEASERVRLLIRLAALRRARRQMRELAVALRPPWLEAVTWPFPTWRVRKRPFDWQIDGRNEWGRDWLDLDRGEQLLREAPPF